jgi:hypothetical protein
MELISAEKIFIRPTPDAVPNLFYPWGVINQSFNLVCNQCRKRLKRSLSLHFLAEKLFNDYWVQILCLFYE